MEIFKLDSKSIVNEIRSGGIVNRVRVEVAGKLEELNFPTLEDFIAQAQTQDPSITEPIATDAYNKLKSANDALNNLLDRHDELLGGKTNGQNFMTVLKTLDTAKKLDGENACTEIQKALGTIGDIAKEVEDALRTIDAIKTAIEDIPAAIEAGFDEVVNYAATTTEKLATEVAALAKAQVVIAEHALANNITQMLGDNCLAAVTGQIMSDKMKNVVDTAIDDQKRKVSSAINDQQSKLKQLVSESLK